MNLLDTNIISEIMRVKPSPLVVEWLNNQDSHSLFVSTVTIGKIEYSLQILPDGKKQINLRRKFERFITQAFSYRVLDIDSASAKLYGTIMSDRRNSGLSTSVPDGQIAAIARSNKMRIVTRNTKDFKNCGIEIVDPFKDHS